MTDKQLIRKPPVAGHATPKKQPLWSRKPVCCKAPRVRIPLSPLLRSCKSRVFLGPGPHHAILRPCRRSIQSVESNRSKRQIRSIGELINAANSRRVHTNSKEFTRNRSVQTTSSDNPRVFRYGPVGDPDTSGNNLTRIASFHRGHE